MRQVNKSTTSMSRSTSPTTKEMDSLPVDKLSLETKACADEAIEQEPEKSAEGQSTLYPKILKLTDFLYQAKLLIPPPTSINLTGSVKLRSSLF